MKKNLLESANSWLNEGYGDEKFFDAYVEAALWSSTDDNDEPLDRNYDKGDIAEETLAKMKSDCLKFRKENYELYDDNGWDDEQAGHDFWLSRNGHGAGFFDKQSEDGSYDVGEKLQKIAKSYGTFDLIVGDDGQIHGS